MEFVRRVHDPKAGKAGMNSRTPKVRSVNRHVGAVRVEDFADETRLEAVQEFAESLAEFQVTLMGVQAEEVVEDDFRSVVGTSPAAELGGIGQQHQAGEFGVRSERFRRFVVGDDRVRPAEPSVVVVRIRIGIRSVPWPVGVWISL